MISGKPLFAWPAYIPVTFELTILFAALTAVFGWIAIGYEIGQRFTKAIRRLLPRGEMVAVSGAAPDTAGL